ncbi:toprim domain-containing protein [Stenotrophomonas sp. B1-1]|uniref:toprim domain-containing protein n=1 Tax=Stenotrophomonas sp. B1-1 TaxID=2710648 RepID=UPI0013DCB07D|nr:toprim domain-containing protein [Stenotrophomonas sp. B1-1]
MRIDAFAHALSCAGLRVTRVLADGRLHRVPTQGDRSGQLSGWYVLHPGPPLAGAFGNWKTGASERWIGIDEQALSPAELQALRAQVERAQRLQQAARHQVQGQAKVQAVQRWQRSAPARADHPYLVTKAIGTHGIRQDGDHLLIPLRDERGRLWSLQTIALDGTKRFLAGGRKRGLYYSVGREVQEVLCIAEGFATAASIFEATGYPTAVAFDAGNLEPVARVLRNKFPHARLVLCADDDMATAVRTGINPGVANAQRAAEAVGGVVVTPPPLHCSS